MIYALGPKSPKLRKENLSNAAGFLRRSRDRLNKRNRLNAQRMRQLDDVDQPNISLAPFDPADVVSMQVRQLRETFLGKAALHPQFANAAAECYARIRASHLKVYGAV